MSSIKIIKKSELVTSTWSGGTTTQLSIFPENADYASRKFVWRLSSAVVAIEKSDFTPLTGFNRAILSFNNKLSLNHEGHHKIELNPYEVDYFNGSWKTSSYGQVTDFNLMTKEGCFSELIHIKLRESQDIFLDPSQENKAVKLPVKHKTIGQYNNRVDAFYAQADPFVIKLDHVEFKINSGDLIILSNYENETIHLVSDSNEHPINLIHAVIGFDI